MPLVDLDPVKLRLGIPLTNTASDDQLLQLIDQISALVQQHLIGTVIEQTTITDYLDGNGKSYVQTKKGPVQSVTSIYVDDKYGNYGSSNTSFGASTLLTEGVDYALVNSTGVLYRIDDIWYRPKRRYQGDLSSTYQGPLYSNGNIKVTYVAGYVSIPTDLQLAVIDTVALAQAARGRGGVIQSEGYDGYSYSLAGINAAAAWMGYLNGPGGMILNRYRRLAV